MIQNKTISIKVVLLLLTLSANESASAQEWKSDKRINVLFGLTQILASGFNVEANCVYHRLIFDYSHGVSLEFSGNNLPADLRSQDLVVHMPWTTGFGIGYRLKEWLNVRIEPKWHRFEYFYKNDPEISSNRIIAYNTFTLGAGLYSDYRPFRKKDNFLKGILIAPSVRFWPTVSSNPGNKSFAYRNRNSGAAIEDRRPEPGLGLTPWVVNISFGYTFSVKRPTDR
ncbi:MAG TPA: hypothetical protein VMH27_14600 [Puia sp.]|nr:hypothetical protein [Puia sp.]